MKPIILTDASCDLPLDYIEENDIQHLGLTYYLKGKYYEDDFGKSVSYREFYDALRAGELPFTSQINEYRFTEKFKELLKYERPIVYIGMSSGLSGTINSARLARNSVISGNKNADITVIDTKCASLGQGLLVIKAAKMRDEGYCADEIKKCINANMTKMSHWFLVEDLTHLKRGGRISAATAAVGSFLDIKPILYLTEEGTLKKISNARGKKKALRFLAEKFKQNAPKYEKQVVAVSHGDCVEDALYLKNILMKEDNVKAVIVNELGAGLGSHCGQGLVSVFFIGNNR